MSFKKPKTKLGRWTCTCGWAGPTHEVIRTITPAFCPRCRRAAGAGLTDNQAGKVYTD